MSHRVRVNRRRVGRVSVYQHHGGWWVYHRERGKPIRRHVGENAALAECEASLINARLVADAAGVELQYIPSVSELGLQRAQALISSPAISATTASPSTTVTELRRAFLDHHEKVLNSSLATVSRYRTATAYLEIFARNEKTVDPTQIIVPRFIEFLRTIEVSPNGHSNSAKRRLRDKGVIYVLETCRSVYHFGIRHGFIAKNMGHPFAEMRIGALRVRDAKPIFVFDAQQEMAFFRACNPWEFRIHFTIAKTGIRPGELSHALIEDADLELGWLSVRSKAELGWTTKTSRERRVPLIPEAVSILRQVIGDRTAGPLFLRQMIFPKKSAILCGNRAELATAAKRRFDSVRDEKGRPLSRLEDAAVFATLWQDAGAVPVDRIRTSFIRAAHAANLSATCPKSWRHTFATLLQQVNVDLLVRQETLGHKPSSQEASALGMTTVYTHTAPEFHRSEIERALRLRPKSLAFAGEFILNCQNKI